MFLKTGRISKKQHRQMWGLQKVSDSHKCKAWKEKKRASNDFENGGAFGMFKIMLIRWLEHLDFVCSQVLLVMESRGNDACKLKGRRRSQKAGKIKGRVVALCRVIQFYKHSFELLEILKQGMSTSWNATFSCCITLHLCFC